MKKTPHDQKISYINNTLESDILLKLHFASNILYESLHGEKDKDDQWLRSNMAARESALVRHCIARPTSFFLPNLKKPFILPEKKLKSLNVIGGNAGMFEMG